MTWDWTEYPNIMFYVICVATFSSSQSTVLKSSQSSRIPQSFQSSVWPAMVLWVLLVEPEARETDNLQWL